MLLLGDPKGNFRAKRAPVPVFPSPFCYSCNKFSWIRILSRIRRSRTLCRAIPEPSSCSLSLDLAEETWIYAAGFPAVLCCSAGKLNWKGKKGENLSRLDDIRIFGLCVIKVF
ncbi:hypothetical protein TNCT_656641 [Trichonephila clavata]|uniref:Uncharacterized protein n=1 Tax=Trichonephila clavata TaxID=2740835 RepID=A0A8X6FNW9_TRICU|nr:hypothetical protein TNCT_656641 [Trichonephila clavata]